MPYIVFVKENSCLPHRPRTETSAHTGQPLTPGAVIDPQGILGIWENTEYIHQSHTTPHSHRSLDFQGRLLLYCVVKVERSVRRAGDHYHTRQYRCQQPLYFSHRNFLSFPKIFCPPLSNETSQLGRPHP